MYRANARIAVLAAIALFVAAPAAQAAWLGYKNETNKPIVVQTTMVINKQVVRGKAHVLYPGEIAWDNVIAPSTRTLSIYDPKANNQLIHQDTVTVANADIFLGVQSVVPPAQPGIPAPQPFIKLAVTRAPVAPGVVRNNPAAKPATPTPTPTKPGTPAPTPTKPGTPAPTPTKPGTPAPAPTKPATPAPTPGKPNQPPPGKPQEQPKPNTPPKTSK